MYRSRLQKARFMLGLPINWRTQAVKNLPDGRKNAENRTWKFPNFIQTEDIVRIIAAETVAAQFAQIAFLSHLCTLRAHSKTLRLLRAYSNYRLADPVPQEDKSRICIRTYQENEPLAIQRAFRKNAPDGRILFPPCLWQGLKTDALGIRPPHDA